MGKILKGIFKFIKRIIKKIVALIRKYWVIIVALLVVWFAPQISLWLLSSGAPAWMSTSMAWIATTITPTLTSAGAWVANGTSALFGKGSAFSALPLGTKMAMAAGASLVLFPDETLDLASDVAGGVGDLAGGVASGLLSSVPTWIWWAAGGFVGYQVLKKD